MAAMQPWKGLNRFHEYTTRSGGSSPTVTRGSFVTVDGSNHGVINAADAGTCCGIARTATTTADTEVIVAGGGIWKTTGTASESFEPGDVFYIGGATTISTGSSGEVSQGRVVETTTASGATVLYILLIPSELYTATTHA